MEASQTSLPTFGTAGQHAVRAHQFPDWQNPPSHWQPKGNDRWYDPQTGEWWRDSTNWQGVSSMHKLIIRLDEGVIKVVGNRDGLLQLADVCSRLAMLPETRAESRKLGNHYHYAEYGNNVETSSAEMEILYDPEM